VKTTIDLPQPLLRKAKSLSAERGESLKDFVAEAIQARINALRTGRASEPPQPRWMAHFGELAPYRAEIEAMHKDIDAVFEKIDPKDWE
jgi:hypothetical protein